MAYDFAIAGQYSGRTTFDLYLYIRRDQTDAPNNRSSYAWELRARNNSGSSSSYALDQYNWAVNVGGQVVGGTHSLDFRGGQAYIVLASGTTGWYGHAADGTLNLLVGAQHGPAAIFGTAHPADQYFPTDRIPKVPSKPPTPTITAKTSTGFTWSFAVPGDDGGSPLTTFNHQVATNSTFTAIVSSFDDATSPASVTGMSLGTTYYIRYRAVNAIGGGAWSDTVSVTTYDVPSAPGTPTLGTETTTGVPLSWSVPTDNGGLAITGYQVQRATNSGFTTGLATSDITGTSATIGPLSSGTNYWFRVRAKNDAGYGAYSGVRSTATVPTAPTALNDTSETPTTFTLNWTAPTGNGITGYEIQQSTSSGFSSGVTTWTQGATTNRAISGLTPATTYYYRVRAQTAGGYGAYSAVFSITPGLPAPTLGTVATETTNYKLRVNWSAPSVTTGLIGYRIQTALNSTFTIGVSNFDVGNVLTADLTLTGGRRYWVRVAARTSGGVNAWSSVKEVVHIVDAGNTDGWTRVGTKPAAIAYFTSTGIRRGVTGSTQALWLESLSTGAVTLATNTYGMQRTVTGLKVGKAYRFLARATIGYGAQGDAYRLEVVSESNATAVTITSNTDMGFIDFVADATSVVVRIMLSEAVTVTGASDTVENVAFHGIQLLEMVTDYDVRMRETVYQSNLANHFDLACNSVGASWYVAKDGVTRFRLPGSSLPVAAIFSDGIELGSLHYVDITAGHDTRSMVNRLEVTNYGVDAARTNEQNDELIVSSPASASAYGTRTEKLETNLYSGSPYEQALNTRLAEILDAHDQPQLLVSSIRWNAQEDLAVASAIEVGERILVRFNGSEQDSQIVSIQHEISPDRWMITLNLQKL